MSTDSTWSMATGEDDGRPLIFRIRDGAPAFATKATFPKLLAVTWQFDPTSNNGMPLPDAVERMQQLENLLEPAFAKARQAFLTVVVTGNGVREWQWYAKDQEEVMKLVNETLGELDPFPVQFGFQDDPVWEGYSRFSRNCPVQGRTRCGSRRLTRPLVSKTMTALFRRRRCIVWLLVLSTLL